MITGTFLDEISHDIPSASWGIVEWDADFRAMKRIGIDTVILIRSGYRDVATFDSRVLRRHHPALIASQDLMDIYLRLADKYEMDFFYGTYDSGHFWHRGDHQSEVDINKALADEVWERYGHHDSFKGWYISHEIPTHYEPVMNVYSDIAAHLKGIKDLPILISPYIKGRKQFDDPISLNEHEKEWEQVFARIQGKVDIVAFQDGNVDYAELGDYLSVNSALASKYGIRCWSNVESFDRDMPIKFYPLDWRKLQFKIEASLAARVDKLITFEFSHFMSPNSIYPSARQVYKRYCENYMPSHSLSS